MILIKLLFVAFLLLLSYVIRIYTGLSLKTYDTNRPAIFRNATFIFLASVMWIGLLLIACFVLYQTNPIFLIISLLLYFFVFNFFFLKRFIRSFGGDLVFPGSLRLAEGAINAMIHSYVSIKKALNGIDEKEIMLQTLKTRYPFMRNKKRKVIIEDCQSIRDLIYSVLKNELIDFDIHKSAPIKKHIDEMITRKMQEF